MCTQKPPHNYSEQLYQRYKDTLEQVFAQNVLPKIDSASEDELSMVVKEQWSLFRIFVKWMESLFSYLNRFHITRQNLPGLWDIGQGIFVDNLRQRLPEDIFAILEDDTETLILTI